MPMSAYDEKRSHKVRAKEWRRKQKGRGWVTGVPDWPSLEGEGNMATRGG